jgi:hypothetical protein
MIVSEANTKIIIDKAEIRNFASTFVYINKGDRNLQTDLLPLGT